jgi:uncharacterized protein (DUF983 family)
VSPSSQCEEAAADRPEVGQTATAHPGSGPPRPAIVATLLRGLRMRCPHCGRGTLFARRLRLRERCDACACDYTAYGHDTWAFVYLSTAGLTGVVVVAMLVVRPLNLWLGRLGLVVVAAALIPLSLPPRKGLAIALNYLIETRMAGTTSDPSGDAARDEPPEPWSEH